MQNFVENKTEISLAVERQQLFKISLKQVYFRNIVYRTAEPILNIFGQNTKGWASPLWK